MPQAFDSYSLSWSRKIMTFIFFFVLVTATLQIIVGVFYLLITLPSDFKLTDVIILILMLGVAMTFLSPSLLCLPNVEPDIQVWDEGLRVQFFWFWWLSIPWEDIESMHAPLLGHSKSLLVITRKLTFVHRLIGFIYGSFSKPAFLISSKLEGYNQLISIIKNRLRTS